MATPSSSKLSRIIKRLARLSRPAILELSETSETEGPPSGSFANTHLLSPEEIDSEWLNRPELRSRKDVEKHLEATDFPKRPGTLTALFVDARCGLIRSQVIGAATQSAPGELVRTILREASNCQAHGIILASCDPTSASVERPEVARLTTGLSQKADAMGIAFLNHFILKAEGWETIHPLQSASSRDLLRRTERARITTRPISEGIRRAFRDTERARFYEPRSGGIRSGTGGRGSSRG